MKKLFTLVGILLISLSLNSFAGNYRLDQSKINAMMSDAQEVVAISVFDLSSFNSIPGNDAVLTEKDPTVAFVLSLVVGYLGIHRLYLGTEPVTFIVYLITGGGCGIITLIDTIMLLMVLIDDEKSLTPYIDNPEILMWKDQM